MVGVLLTLLFVAGAVGVGSFLLRRLCEVLDPALSVAVTGAFGLGFIGWISFPIGLLPGGTNWGLWIVAGIAAFGVVILGTSRQGFGLKLPTGVMLLFPVALALAALFSLISVLAPSDINEWDSLAYHLAVPKLWIEAGQIEFIPYIHHSNFPFAVDNLYIWGLQWGGESGAKAFQLAYLLLGVLGIFGFARMRYGTQAGWWAALAFTSVPSILWESGTAYIDVAHGLYAGMGILFGSLALGEGGRRYLWLAALFLGLGAASKYTGLQTIVAVCAVVLAAGVIQKRATQAFGSAVLIGVLAAAIASPWLIRNVVNVGNPVYPFFYETLKGENWDQRRADIYRNEQKSFGVGSDAASIGHAMLGLAYQPGRYVNPAPSSGLGSPLGAFGVAMIATFMLWAISGRARGPEALMLGAVFLSALMWFALSQQSRYITTWAVPLSVLAGAGAIRLGKAGFALAGAVAIQAVVSLFLMSALRTSTQSKVVLGEVSAEEYRAATIPFYTASQVINQKVKGGKVALYDEVFGYLLNVPYFWANPGHSTRIPYDSLDTGDAFAAELERQGFTHVYINLSPLVKERAFAQKWTAAMGLQGEPTPFEPSERRAIFENWESRWMILLSDAVREGRLQVEEVVRNGVLFKLSSRS